MELVSGQFPTIHFIGVSTKQSSIMNVFPSWAGELGLGPSPITRGFHWDIIGLTNYLTSGRPVRF